jgi:uncharacterized SAM-binding protein YcdF (DUF218 family)
MPMLRLVTPKHGSAVGPSSRAATPELTDELLVDSAESSAPGASSRLRWRRRLLLGILGVVLLAVAVVAATTLWLTVFPATSVPAHADGILSFNGGQEGARSALAVSLAEKGYARVLLFSQGGEGTDTTCPKVPRISVVCFVDVSNNTRGEAEWAGRYAARHHWHSLLIVPGRTQVTRARLLVERCFSGSVTVVAPSGPRPAVMDVIHQWGGLLDALLVHRSC